jgi:hypothetical protein
MAPPADAQVDIRIHIHGAAKLFPTHRARTRSRRWARAPLVRIRSRHLL